MNDKITGLEKAALIATGAAAAYKTLLWSLEASVDSTDLPIVILRIVFAFVSFAAFDLVLMAVVSRGWSWSGAGALLVAAAASAAIGLEVGLGGHWPALHAAPAITLAAFGLHLMLCQSKATAAAAAPDTPTGAVTQAVQVNVGAPLPRTIAGFIKARALEAPEEAPEQLALSLGTRPETVRRALAVTAPVEAIEQGPATG